MNIKEQTIKMDAIVAQGAIVDAVKQFFAENATTSDYNKLITSNKEQMVKKMEDFAGSIQEVNEIIHHYTIVDGNISASEFTFNFNMKDGSKIYWNEIIRRLWNSEGKVTEEKYFNAQ